jgi:hypothetical protein
MKKYKMILADDDGNVYKSDNVKLMNAQVHNVGREELYAEIMVSAQGFKIEMNEAETPPEMPTAAVAAKATKIIQEEKRDRNIAEEWEKLTKEICQAVKRGEEEITVKTICIANKERLMKMGYEVNRDSCHYVFRIRWVELDSRMLTW